MHQELEASQCSKLAICLVYGTYLKTQWYRSLSSDIGDHVKDTRDRSSKMSPRFCPFFHSTGIDGRRIDSVQKHSILVSSRPDNFDI